MTLRKEGYKILLYFNNFILIVKVTCSPGRKDSLRLGWSNKRKCQVVREPQKDCSSVNITNSLNLFNRILLLPTTSSHVLKVQLWLSCETSCLVESGDLTQPRTGALLRNMCWPMGFQTVRGLQAILVDQLKSSKS